MSADDDADRAALLRLLLAEEGLADVVAPTIRRRPPDAPPSLSYAQERMWFLTRLEPDATALNLRVAARVRGPLDLDALHRAVAEVVRRHEILRTVVIDDAGEPVPLVLESASVPFRVEEVATPDELDAALAADAAQPFAIDRELPIRVVVYRVDADDHVVTVVMHHIAADGWSLQVLGRELDALYAAFASGEPSPLEPLPIQYADYAHWQRSDTADARLGAQLDYWCKQLAPPLPVCEIPPDFPRPKEQRYAGASTTRSLDPQSVAGLRRLATASRATLFMVLLAGFEVVVSRHAGQDEVVVGVPVAGRVRPELEPLIGAFLNNLALRNDLSDDPTFAELVDRVRATSLEAFDNQDVPFERLLAELKPPRDRSRTPIFQIFFNLQAIDTSARRADFLTHLEHEPMPEPEPESKFDITMYVTVDGDQVDLRCVYNRALYRADTIDELVDQYVQLLREVVADPYRPVGAYSLLTERGREVAPSSDGPVDNTWHGSVPDAVRRHADGADAFAVDDRGRPVTYRTLVTRMEQIAAWLRVRGVEPGSVVAILGHRSSALVASVLGALDAGCPYVVLDPRYPARRLARLVEIARPSAWLRLVEAGAVPHEVDAALDSVGLRARLDVPADLATFDALDAIASDRAAAHVAGPDDPACLTFTSGSTGQPKAVLGRHGSLTHFLPWMSDHFDVTAADRFSMLSGLSHDPLQRDMFWPLWLGATIVVPDGDRMHDPGYIASWLRETGVTVAHLTPAMGQLLVEGDVPPAGLVGLRRAFFIGDVLTRSDVERLRKVAPGATVVNLYGTTETQRASGFRVVSEVDLDGAARREVLPIGRAMPGTRLVVLTARRAPAAIGEIGDIWFRGPHLAIGYANDPDETEHRFLPHDPAGDPNDRWYRTGDRGRYTVDGDIEFIGRSDDQVQVRGFRIELGEIEGALRRCAGVSNAIVRRIGSVPTDATITAYVVFDSGVEPDVAGLRRSLVRELPAHMVPTHIVVIDRVPLTPNGKLDVRGLPEPHAITSGAELGRRAGSPRDELERVLTSIWSEVLGREVGVDDSFFELGGYSLLATRMFALIEQRTGHRLPVSVLFEHPTVAHLADAIRNDGWRHEWTSLVPIQPRGGRRALFYVAPYMISVLELASLGEVLGDDQPLYGFQPQGLDGTAPAHTSIEEMAAHYIAEMRSVQPEGPYAVGGHCAGAWVAFEMARQLEAAGEELSNLFIVDLGPPGVERPPVNPLVYVANHVRHYVVTGRLRHAIAWKIKVLVARHLLRRVGPPTARFTSTVRETHRAAYGVYRGGEIRHDITLVLSDDSVVLRDAAWYGLWRDRTAGEVATHHVGGTHANLLVKPYVQRLGEVIMATMRNGGASRPRP